MTRSGAVIAAVIVLALSGCGESGSATAGSDSGAPKAVAGAQVERSRSPLKLDASKICGLLPAAEVTQLMPGSDAGLRPVANTIRHSGRRDVSCQYRSADAGERPWLSVIISTSSHVVPARFDTSEIPSHAVTVAGHAGAYTPGAAGAGAVLLVQLGRAALGIQPYPLGGSPYSVASTAPAGEAPPEYEPIAKAVAAQVLKKIG